MTTLGNGPRKSLPYSIIAPRIRKGIVQTLLTKISRKGAKAQSKSLRFIIFLCAFPLLLCAFAGDLLWQLIPQLVSQYVAATPRLQFRKQPVLFPLVDSIFRDQDHPPRLERSPARCRACESANARC